MNKRLVILGSGESGTGAAILAKTKGYDVFVSDYSEIKSKYIDDLTQYDIPYESGTHTLDKILNADVIIKSPGIGNHVPIIKSIIDQNIPILSEIEFAAQYTNATLIGITGTNGKTTTTLLLYHILKKANYNVGLAGNIGDSFAKQVALNQFDYYVLELSSFQLDYMYNTRIHYAILTNITPDHLDRYDYKFDNYIQSKFRISQNQKSEDLFIYCSDDLNTTNHLTYLQGKAEAIPFAIDTTISKGAFFNSNQKEIQLLQLNHKFTMPINQITIRGKHNVYNSMAAAIVADALHIRKEIIRESLSDFKNVEHRLEFVSRIKGVDFINDSKATNVNSAWYALECMETPVVWIVGGTDKGNDYSQLLPLVKQKVHTIICLGLDNKKIHDAFGSLVDLIINTQSAQMAVEAAYKFSNKGDTVLLSPACASFDLFENYEDRGQQFKKWVKNL